MLTAVTTYALDGITPRPVTVEVDLRRGLPAFTIVGLGDRAVREARERVQAAIGNSGWTFPQQRVTVNLAPADLRKEGPGFDLAIACGLLAATGEVPADTLAGTAVFGELALSGDLRPCRGVLAVAEGAMEHGRKVGWTEMQPYDLAVVGCVAVTRPRAISQSSTLTRIES